MESRTKESNSKFTTNWIKKEFAPNKEMMPVKAIIFLFVSGVAAFMPYLTLHMTEVGLTMPEIAVIYAVVPVVSILGPTIAGMIADKLENYTMVLFVNIFLTGLLHSLLLVVPPNLSNLKIINATAEREISGIPLNFTCGPDRYSFETKTSVESNCRKPDSELLLLNFQNCQHFCDGQLENMICFLYSSSSDERQMCIGPQKIDFNVTLLESEGSNCSYKIIDITPLPLGMLEILDVSCSNECHYQCEASTATNTNTRLNAWTQNSVPSSRVTFYLYFILRILATMALSVSFSMLDSVVLAKIKDCDGDYGKQRTMLTLGQAIAPLISGVLVHNLNAGKSIIDYSSVFYFGDIVLIICIMVLLKLRVRVEMASPRMLKDMSLLLSRMQVNIFLIIITLLGMNWGFLETYLFIYLEELGSPIYLFGITLTVGMCSGIPILFLADRIVKRLGRHNIFLLSFLTYFVRFMGYSLIKNPWMCLIFELLEVFTYQIMWVAAATYCPLLAPKGLLATMTAIAGSAHYSLGKGLGSFIGGYFILWFGSVKSFQIFAYMSLSGAAIQLATYYGYVKKVLDAQEMASDMNRNQNGPDLGQVEEVEEEKLMI